eukprot:10834790-Alexandrium_andersonii.AAC.1
MKNCMGPRELLGGREVQRTCGTEHAHACALRVANVRARYEVRQEFGQRRAFCEGYLFLRWRALQ